MKLHPLKDLARRCFVVWAGKMEKKLARTALLRNRKKSSGGQRYLA
jgi:hypothetical protein